LNTTFHTETLIHQSSSYKRVNVFPIWFGSGRVRIEN